MIANLAEELYANSIQLKKYDSRKLLFNKNRLALEKELYQIQSQVNELIALLKDNPNYSVDYIKLAAFMSNQITECILFLTTKGKANRKTVNGQEYQSSDGTDAPFMFVLPKAGEFNCMLGEMVNGDPDACFILARHMYCMK